MIMNNSPNSNKAILYSFRRCPFAMRARAAIYFSKIKVELREVLLRDKPSEMIDISSKLSCQHSSILHVFHYLRPEPHAYCHMRK